MTEGPLVTARFGCRAFHLQALSLFRDAAEYDGWLRQIRAPVLAIAGDKDALTPLVYSPGCLMSHF